MAGMVRHIIPPFLVLLCCLVIVKCRLHCLVWYINQDQLNFKCIVPGFSHPISLIDSQGKLYTNCSFDRGTPTCTPLIRKDFLEDAHYAYNFIIFTIPKLNKNMDGLWVCVQNNLRLTTNVSLLRGIIDSTEVSIAGQFNNEKHNPEIKVTCSSCREPDVRNVEFLENGRSEDSLTFIQNTRKCTHYKGECHPDECNCTGTEFVRTFPYNFKSNRTTYACDMLFTDPFTNEKFSKLASMIFNGKEFYPLKTSVSIKKAGDKIWNETFLTSRQKESNTGLEPARMTPITVTVTVTEHISAETSGLNPHLIIAIVIGCVVVLMFVLVLLHQRYIQRKLHTKEPTELATYRESELLLNKQPCSLSTDKETESTQIEEEREFDLVIHKQPCSSNTKTETESTQIEEERESDLVIHKQHSSSNTETETEPIQIDKERASDLVMHEQPCSSNTETESAQFEKEGEFELLVNKQPCSQSTEKESTHIEKEGEPELLIHKQPCSSSAEIETESTQIDKERESDLVMHEQPRSSNTETESAQFEKEGESELLVNKQPCSQSTDKESAQLEKERESELVINKQLFSPSTEKDKTSDKCIMTDESKSFHESAVPRPNRNIKEGYENQNSGSDNQLFELQKEIKEMKKVIQSLKFTVLVMQDQMTNTSTHFMNTVSFKNKLLIYLENRFNEFPGLNVQHDTEFMSVVNSLLNGEGCKDNATAYGYVTNWSYMMFAGFRNTLCEKIEKQMKKRDLSSVTIEEFSKCIMLNHNIREGDEESPKRIRFCLLLRSYLFDDWLLALDKNKFDLPDDFWDSFMTYVDKFVQNKEQDKWTMLTVNDLMRKDLQGEKPNTACPSEIMLK